MPTANTRFTGPTAAHRPAPAVGHPRRRDRTTADVLRPTDRLADTVERIERIVARLARTAPERRDEAAVLANVDWLRRELAASLAGIAARLVDLGAWEAASAFAEAAGSLAEPHPAPRGAGDTPRAIAEHLLALGRARLADAKALLAPEPPDPGAAAARVADLCPHTAGGEPGATVCAAPSGRKVGSTSSGAGPASARRAGFDPERWDVFRRPSPPSASLRVHGPPAEATGDRRGSPARGGVGPKRGLLPRAAPFSREAA